jgi:hypothetical protein
MLTRIFRTAALLALLGASACDDTPVGPGDPLRGKLVTLPALGVGRVPERFTAELHVHPNRTIAYTTTWGTRGGSIGNAVKVWNVAGNTPVLVDSVLVSGATTLGDVQVSDDGRLLVVATERRPNGSIVIYDLANPAKPRETSRFTSPNTSNGVHTAEVARVNGTLYAFLSVDPSPPQLVIVDLSDPERPREVLARPMGSPFIHDVFVRDGLLFTALWNAGMTLWDIGGGGRGGSPADPVQIGNVQTAGGRVHNVWWFHDRRTGSKRYAFVGEEAPGSGPFGTSSAGDVHVVDVSDLAKPREVAFFTVPGAGTHNFSVDEQNGVLYAAYYNGGVRALDVRGDLGKCSAEEKDAAGRCDLGRMGREVGRGLLEQGPVFVWGVHHVGTHLYASDMLNGLWKLDASALRR